MPCHPERARRGRVEGSLWPARFLQRGGSSTALDRFATSLQRERQDFNGRMLTIRRSDLRVLASCMGRSLEELGSRLEQLGLRASAAAS